MCGVRRRFDASHLPNYQLLKGIPAMPTGAYSMQIGDADARRLQLLGQFYDPMSSAFLEAAGVRPGDTVADLGCGHGGVTERIAARVGDAGQVYAVDASPDQLPAIIRDPPPAACGVPPRFTDKRLEELWDNGIDTDFSCQSDDEGHAMRLRARYSPSHFSVQLATGHFE
jgi:SAM-dependent methyltransferase